MDQQPGELTAQPEDRMNPPLGPTVQPEKPVAQPDRSQLGLARIERETVQERVYGVLRDQLMRGAFEPGQKLKIAELATALGTSAMPVREALNRLAAERAIESLPNRSVRVPSLSAGALQDLMETRFAVEGLAVTRAAANMTDGTLTRLRELIAAQSETDSEHISEASAELNRTFHFTLYKQSGSTVLLPIIESLWLQFGPYMRVASERFAGDPELTQVLIKLAREKDTRKCFILLGAILDTPGLADRLLEALQPQAANSRGKKGGRI